MAKAQDSKGHRPRKKDISSLMALLFGTLVITILMVSNIVARGFYLDSTEIPQTELEDGTEDSYFLASSGVPLPLEVPSHTFSNRRMAAKTYDHEAAESAEFRENERPNRLTRFSNQLHAVYHSTRRLATSILSSSNSSAANSTVTSASNSTKRGKRVRLDCAAFGGIENCPDWIRIDSPCSPAHPCRDLSLEHHYVHPACQPTWVGRRRDGTRYYTSKHPSGKGAATGTGFGSRRRRHRRRGPSVDWYANGLRPSTTRSYPGNYNGGRLRWSPQPRPPYVHGFYPGTCEPDNYQGLWNGVNESAFNNGTARRTCQCDLRCEARRDCCCDVNYWRAQGRWAVIREGVDPGIA